MVYVLSKKKDRRALVRAAVLGCRCLWAASYRVDVGRRPRMGRIAVDVGAADYVVVTADHQERFVPVRDLAMLVEDDIAILWPDLALPAKDTDKEVVLRRSDRLDQVVGGRSSRDTDCRGEERRFGRYPVSEVEGTDEDQGSDPQRDHEIAHLALHGFWLTFSPERETAGNNLMLISPPIFPSGENAIFSGSFPN